MVVYLFSLIHSYTKNHTKISTTNYRRRRYDNTIVCCHRQPQTNYHLDKRLYSCAANLNFQLYYIISYQG